MAKNSARDKTQSGSETAKRKDDDIKIERPGVTQGQVEKAVRNADIRPNAGGSSLQYDP